MSRRSKPSDEARDFTTKKREGRFTAAKQARFLDLYSEGGSVGQHARKLGISRRTIFYTARNDPDFAARYREAIELNLDATEDDLGFLAQTLNVTAIFGKLRAGRPEKYRENMRVTGDLNLTTTSAEDLEQARRRAQEREALETRH